MSIKSKKTDALVDYIFHYCNEFWTEKEKLAFQHYSSVIKMQNLSEEQKKSRTQLLLQHGWMTGMTDDKDILDLLKDGFDAFRINLTNRIYEEHKNDIQLNLCPKCGEIARTPQAKQCRWCGHDWH